MASVDTHTHTHTHTHTQSKAFGCRGTVMPTRWTSTGVFVRHPDAKSQCRKYPRDRSSSPQEAVHVPCLTDEGVGTQSFTRCYVWHGQLAFAFPVHQVLINVAAPVNSSQFISWVDWDNQLYSKNNALSAGDVTKTQNRLENGLAYRPEGTSLKTNFSYRNSLPAGRDALTVWKQTSEHILEPPLQSPALVYKLLWAPVVPKLSCKQL